MELHRDSFGRFISVNPKAKQRSRKKPKPKIKKEEIIQSVDTPVDETEEGDAQEESEKVITPSENINNQEVKTKELPVKPRLKDYKNSSEYQKALSKYYKSIE